MAEYNPKGGLNRKFKVDRLAPSSRGIDHTKCDYFVLDPLHDPVARQALIHYASLVDQVGDHKFAADLFAWLAQLIDTDSMQ